MKAYADIVESILTSGAPKQNRTGVGTTSTFCEVFRHNMANGFPLLTLRRLPIKSILVELEGFIKGVTDKAWYVKRGCTIWNEWSNPTQKSPNDLGPIYGYQWRSFCKFYGEMDGPEHNAFYDCEEQRASPVGVDQLKFIVETLMTNPNDRRMVCSAWNPNQMKMMALPPCHYAFNVVVTGGRLNLVWNQRSCDVGLGLPFNIASYATLLLLLAKNSNLEPGELVGTLHDAHIYDNHRDKMAELIHREPKPLPTFKITNFDGIFNWTHKDYELIDYSPHPKMNIGPVAV